MSAHDNTAKLGTAHNNIQTAQSSPSLVGSEPTKHLSAHYWVSTLTHYTSQAYINNSSITIMINIYTTIECFSSHFDGIKQ